MHILSTVLGCLYATTLYHVNFSIHELPDDYAKNVAVRSPQSLTTLKKRKMCQTTPYNKSMQSSEHYRSLLFEALQNCQHPRPEVVMLINDPRDLSACVSIDNQHGVYVNFDENNDWAKTSYGTQRMVLHHESAHVVKKHYSTINTSTEQQDEERMADQIAVISSKCTQCSRDFAQYFLCQHAQKKYKDPVLKKHRKITLRHIDAMPKEEVAQLIEHTSGISRKRKSTHPIEFERTLRIHQDSLILGSALCTYHQKKQH